MTVEPLVFNFMDRSEPWLLNCYSLKLLVVGMSGLARMKSQCWSAETLLRGIGNVAGQPEQRLSTSPVDKELLQEYQASLVCLCKR